MSPSEINKRISERKSFQFGSKSKLGSSLPNKTKENLKKEIKESLKEYPEVGTACNLYSKLIKV